jgi:hypothetical protein
LFRRIANIAFHLFTLCIPLFFYYFTGQGRSSNISIHIDGTGVVRINGVVASNLQARQDSSDKEVTQILELHNCMVGNVIFESKNGEVVLSGDSQVTGLITGGKIRT